jgi:NAD+ synthase (glutamine-hydrolysing)
MKNIQPITCLRNTNQLEKDLQEVDGPLFITKNGYSDFVILSPEHYASLAKTSYETPEVPLKIKSASLKPVIQSDPLGMVRVRASSLEVDVCHVSHNKEKIMEAVEDAYKANVKILVLPELCLTGYTAGDMFFAATLAKEVENAISEIVSFSKGREILFVFGTPLNYLNALYNCAVVIFNGKILGIVPKTYIPNYCEFYEARYFKSAPSEDGYINLANQEVPFSKRLIFVDENYADLKIAVEICEDLWVPETPSTKATLEGADVILNLSSSNEVVGKKEFRTNLVKMTSARLNCAYIYADSGNGESTTDLVFASHNIIAENGTLLGESPLFAMKSVTSEIDIEKLLAERRKTTTFAKDVEHTYSLIPFAMELKEPETLLRHYSQNPFIPESEKIDLDRVSLILKMQAEGLAKRLKTVHQKKVFIGLSGGLDSTLALLVSVETFKILNYPLDGVNAVTLPAFGTSKRTHDNAMKLASELGVSFREINIKDSLNQHFKDINYDSSLHDVTYENAQARERTLVLMDLANKEGGLMVGTGDLSELCLGWTTYSGDHMSMYGVNASIPKTLVKYLVRGYAELHKEASDSLLDIVDTPISPELLPTDKQGQIAQKTEDKIGPYELHDFFIYHFLRFGYRPKKLYYLARQAYKGKYDDLTIKKWLKEFFTRFFHNEFKRSCLPDGAKVGTVAISPRGDLRMPSDASVNDFIKEIETL